MTPTPSPPDNPLADALRGLFGPLLELLKGWPPLLSFGGVTMLLVVVLALLGAVVPGNLVPLLYLAFVLTWAAFVWMLRDERRRVPKPTPSDPVLGTGPSPVQPPSAPPTPPVVDVSTLEREYLGRLAQRCNQLQLRVMDPKTVEREKRGVIALSAVYVHLNVLQPAQDERLAQRSRQPDEAREPLTALQALVGSPQTVLLGDPGSGKSTLVNYLVYHLAQARLQSAAQLAQALPGWPYGDLLPVRVVLREFAAYAPVAEAQRGSADLVWRFLRHDLNADGLGDFCPELEKAIRRGRAMLFFDGLDEVPDDQRAVVQTSLADFVTPSRRDRALVTCRVYAYQELADRLEGFETFTLAPFDDEQIKLFLQRWYGELTALEWFKADEAQARARQLQAAIAGQPGLQVLAPNPLLLTMMALLHTWRGQLPQDRVELYGDIIRLLMERWETARLGDAERRGLLALLDVPGLTLAELEKELQKVVFAAHGGQQPGQARAADVREADLIGALRPVLLDDPARAQTFVDFIRDRSGLLLWNGRVDQFGGRLYSLPHRTFQEYLAGAYLAGRGDFPNLVTQLSRQDHQRWREVILLAVGKAARDGYPDLALKAVEALCPPQEPADDADWRNAWLAGEALPEVGRAASAAPAQDDALLQAMGLSVQATTLSPEALRQRARQRLATLLETAALPPVERAAAGRALSALDDPRPGIAVLPPHKEGASPLPDIAWRPVPGGVLQMGSAQDDKLAYSREYGPDGQPFPVPVKPFFIAAYPITNAQFRPFVQGDGYTNPTYWTPEGWQRKDQEKWAAPRYWDDPRWNLDNHPVVGVTWYEAVAYCKWANEQMGKWAHMSWRPVPGNGQIGKWENTGWQMLFEAARPSSVVVRLPTEVEWEWTARGPEALRWLWGDEWEEGICNSIEAGLNRSSAVGAFPGSAALWLARQDAPVHDLAGNVLEWCATRWQDKYPLPQVDEWSDDYLAGTSPRLVRGGSFASDNQYVRGAYRVRYVPHVRYDVVGFRVAAGSSAWL